MPSYVEVPVLHDFAFPSTTNVLEITREGEHIVAAGTYTPRVAIYDLLNYSQKCERNTTEETKAICIVEDDWKKLALLQKNRTIEFHTRFGTHYTMQLPTEGRALRHNSVKAELLVAGKTGEVYRLNLEEGRFYKPISTGISAIETMALSEVHSLCVVGGGEGCIEFIDLRDNRSVRTHRINSGKETEITAASFSEDGIQLAAGTSGGEVVCYDMRGATPLLTKDHIYEFPIRQVEHAGKHVASLDEKGVKIWEKRTGRTVESIEPGAASNTFCINGGLIFIGGDEPEVRTYYVPSLGVVPRWCSHLEGVTDDVAEKKKPLFFSNYRFVTEEELAVLGLEKCVEGGVSVYMHGYLVKNEVYEEAEKSAALGESGAEARAQGEQRRKGRLYAEE